MGCGRLEIQRGTLHRSGTTEWNRYEFLYSSSPMSSAAAALLYFGLATPEQGRAVAARLERDFLEPGAR